MPRVTVIIPTHNHGRLILTAVRSLLRQTHRDFEVFIIGDGVTPETREAAVQAVALDSRIRFLDRPKSPRLGEPYRHELLQTEATGEIICYLSDDDLLMPDHLEVMCRALEGADMVHALPLQVNTEGALVSTLIDLALPEWVQWTLDGNGKNSLSFVGHTMEFYRRLPHGWRTTPVGTFTDRYMWVQMLAMPGVRATCTWEFTVLGLISSVRKGRSLEQREEELVAWENRIVREHGQLMVEARRALARSFYQIETELGAQVGELEKWEKRRAALPGFARNLLRWWWRKKGVW